jgi:hypothetical protein
MKGLLKESPPVLLLTPVIAANPKSHIPSYFLTSFNPEMTGNPMRSYDHHHHLDHRDAAKKNLL